MTNTVLKNHREDSVGCIFCKIVAGQVPSYNVYEDTNFVAFLDKFPQTPGHCQVVPKKHYRWVWDVPNLGAYFEACGKIARALQKAFHTEMVQSRILGDQVPHAHIWLIPIHEEKITAEDEIVGRIKAEL